MWLMRIERHRVQQEINLSSSGSECSKRIEDGVKNFFVSVSSSLPPSNVMALDGGGLMRLTIAVEPIFIHLVGHPAIAVPTVATLREPRIQSLRSPAFPPNVYLFCGQVLIHDEYTIEWKHHRFQPGYKEYMADTIIDCGVPLNVTFGPRSCRSFIPEVEPQKINPGDWIAGVGRLQLRGEVGLFQSTMGQIKSVYHVDMRPESSRFGDLVSLEEGVPIGYDPEAMSEDFLFADIVVAQVLNPEYVAFPARSKDSPEPVIPALG